MEPKQVGPAAGFPPFSLPRASSPDRYITFFFKKKKAGAYVHFPLSHGCFLSSYVTSLYQSYPQLISTYRKQRERTGAGYRAGGSAWTLAFKSCGGRLGGDSLNGLVTGVMERVHYCSTCFAWPFSDLLHQVKVSCRRGSRKQEIPAHWRPTGVYCRLMIEAPFVPYGMAI